MYVFLAAKKIIKATLLIGMMSLFCVGAQAQDESPKHQQEDIKVAVMEVLDVFMETFNRMDVAAMESTYQFPHYRYASGKMNILEAPSGRSGESLKKAIGAEWHHSAWLRRNIIHMSDTKVHVDTEFVRYREDGTVISRFDSLYILTKEDGRWGIKLRSSMAP
ncbi:hypothetical protein [Aurantivibrio infirmus]